jgi:hypothetical protein
MSDASKAIRLYLFNSVILEINFPSFLTPTWQGAGCLRQELEKNEERKAWCITILTIFAVVFWLAEGTFRLPTAAIKGHLREGIKRRKLCKLKINAKRLRYL